jgi:ABC-2 type transport system ATP-binding protein
MEEAEQADAVTILHEGRVVAAGAPAALRASLSGEVLEVETTEPALLAAAIEAQFGVATRVAGGTVRVQGGGVPDLVPRLMAEQGARIVQLNLHRPSLEDVFLDKTGHRFWGEA